MPHGSPELMTKMQNWLWKMFGVNNKKHKSFRLSPAFPIYRRNLTFFVNLEFPFFSWFGCIFVFIYWCTECSILAEWRILRSHLRNSLQETVVIHENAVGLQFKNDMYQGFTGQQKMLSQRAVHLSLILQAVRMHTLLMQTPEAARLPPY